MGDEEDESIGAGDEITVAGALDVLELLGDGSGATAHPAGSLAAGSEELDEESLDEVGAYDELDAPDDPSVGE